MKNLRNWAFALAVSIFVAGAAAIQAQPSGWLGLYVGESSGATQARGLNRYGAPIFVGRGTSVPSDAVDGELFNIVSSTAQTRLVTYSGFSQEWNEVSVDGRVQRAFREDFTSGAAQNYEEDLTAAVLTDGADGVLLFPGGDIGSIAYTITNADNLDAAAAPFATVGILAADAFVDAEDDNGVVFLYPAMADGAVGPGAWNESSGSEGYCEARVDIVDISDTDDFWFGMFVQEAYDAPPASADYDTGAWFTLSDIAGDLDIEVELNDTGAPANDDTGVTWGDGETYIMRVEVAADSVEFFLSAADAADGALLTSVATQSNAAVDFDDGDIAVCVLGWTNAGAGDPTVTVDYLEYGVTQ